MKKKILKTNSAGSTKLPNFKQHITKQEKNGFDKKQIILRHVEENRIICLEQKASRIVLLLYSSFSSVQLPCL